MANGWRGGCSMWREGMMEVTDDMVNRYRTKQSTMFGTNQSISIVRELLEAVLTPPSIPEIEVTPAMVRAGIEAHADFWCAPGDAKHPNNEHAVVYRAMRKLEPSYLAMPTPHEHKWGLKLNAASGGGGGPSYLEETYSCACGATKSVKVTEPNP